MTLYETKFAEAAANVSLAVVTLQNVFVHQQSLPESKRDKWISGEIEILEEVYLRITKAL